MKFIILLAVIMLCVSNGYTASPSTKASNGRTFYFKLNLCNSFFSHFYISFLENGFTFTINFCSVLHIQDIFNLTIK